MSATKAKNSKPKAQYLANYKKPDFFIETVDLNFDLHDDITHVTSKMYINRQGTKDAPLKLSGQDLELVYVMLDGKNPTYSIDGETLTLENVPDQFELTINNDIDPASNTSLEGLYMSNGMFCTQCEAHGFRRITYFLDRPDVMATYKVRIEADKTNYPVLLSNGNQTGAGDVTNGRHFVTWHDPFPKPSYLFGLVAGELDYIEDHYMTNSGTDVSLRIFVEKDDLAKCAHAMASLKASMKWDEVEYGREYDLDIFNIVAVSHFNSGAMENKSLNIFNTKGVLALPETATDTDYWYIEALIGHEYFHNWTGNRVTCRDWFQLSLKEGLTVFREHEFSADMGSRAVSRINEVCALRQLQFPEDGGPLSHPIRPASVIEIDNFYTVTVYKKGAEVIRMMYKLLGPEKYRKAMDLYFERHDGDAVTCEDFVLAMETSSGVDLEQFRLWYSQAGTPEVSMSENYSESENSYELSFEQKIPQTPGQADKKLMHIPIEIGLLDKDGNELLEGGSRLLNLKEQQQTFRFDGLAEKPVPSILRGFSAPVKLMSSQGKKDQIFLIGHDSDSFNRWEAVQKTLNVIILSLVDNLGDESNFSLNGDYIGAMRHVLNDNSLDKAFIAEMFSLPPEGLLGQQKTPANVDGIHKARKLVVRKTAETLKDDFLRIYHECQTNENYQYNAVEVGRRRLKNVVLGYLMMLEDPEINTLCEEQFYAASNMTDEYAALTLLADSDAAGRSVAIEKFYDKWRHEPLVLDKWFVAQALSTRSDVLDQMDILNQHADFDLKMPNRARALITSFCDLNQVSFHDKSGRGYEFLSRNVKELDPVNPQFAAQIITPLTRLKTFDQERQKLMAATLEDILKLNNISKHVYEIVSKSLI